MNYTHFIFGKYKGHLIDQVAEQNPKYVLWAHKNVTWLKGKIAKETLDKAYVNSTENESERATANEEVYGVGLDAWGYY